MECACYASYFVEFADYYGGEGIEATEMLKLLYQSFRPSATRDSQTGWFSGFLS